MVIVIVYEYSFTVAVYKGVGWMEKSGPSPVSHRTEIYLFQGFIQTSLAKLYI